MADATKIGVADATKMGVANARVANATQPLAPSCLAGQTLWRVMMVMMMVMMVMMMVI